MAEVVARRRNSAFLLALIGALAGACTVENPDFAMDGGAARELGGVGADLMTRMDITACKTNAFLGCKTGVVLVRCNATGDGTRTESCPYGCNAAAGRCNQCDPTWPPRCAGDDLYTCTADGTVKIVKCPDDCKDGKCVTSCEKKTYYLDQDKDGHGDPQKKISACDPPSGTAANGDDCNDHNASVFPGQKTYFNKPIPGSNGFDYDCDGKAELKDAQKADCKKKGKDCEGSGWGLFVPACGGTGMWLECVKYYDKCGEKIGARSQSCR